MPTGIGKHKRIPGVKHLNFGNFISFLVLATKNVPIPLVLPFLLD